jgi:glycosyltransferase involved in cell wall biosynthesis
MTESLISICIPAYKKPEYVVRAIQSILKQSYKKVEIIISDDSPNEDIKIAIQPYIFDIDIKYYHNQPALKSPMNWIFRRRECLKFFVTSSIENMETSTKEKYK